MIPAFNEEGRIGSTLERIHEYLRGQPYRSEVIVVDDGSDDGTIPVAKRAAGSAKIYANGENRGKGFSVRRGALEAAGEVVLFSDADLSTPIEEVEKLDAALREGADIAIGSRALAESDVQIHQPFYREWMGKTFNLLVRALVFPGISDTQCGFKAFRREAAREVFSRQTLPGFAFDVEVLYIARRLGYTVREVPVIWRNSPETKVGALRHSLQMFRDILKIRRIHRAL